MAEEPKTLQDIARSKYRISIMPPSDAEITEALRAAEIDPTDENERERFRSLVAAQAHFLNAEELASLGRHLGRAEERLLDTGASQEEIFGLARNYQREDEYYREQMREWQRG
jgi:hypothetical protein